MKLRSIPMAGELMAYLISTEKENMFHTFLSNEQFHET